MQAPARDDPRQAGKIHGVGPGLQPSSPVDDESTQERKPTLDYKYTTSSSIFAIKHSQETRKDGSQKTVINPFLLTASYLVDVHTSKVGEIY